MQTVGNVVALRGMFAASEGSNTAPVASWRDTLSLAVGVHGVQEHRIPIGGADAH